MTRPADQPQALGQYLAAHGFTARAARPGWHERASGQYGQRTIRVVDEGDGPELHVLTPRGACYYSARFTAGTPVPVIIAAIAAAITLRARAARRR